MQYTQHLLDRRSGDFVSVDMGEWITVTELGARYGVGRNKVRTVLQRMGLLQIEGKFRRLRLTSDAVSQGLGKRHDKPKNGKYPFDVISPAGQAVIAADWQSTLNELAAPEQADPLLLEAKAALADYETWRESHRLSEMTTQMRVCWLLDHFDTLSAEQISRIIGTTHQLVSRYASTRRDQLDYRKRRKVSEGESTGAARGLFAGIELETERPIFAA